MTKNYTPTSELENTFSMFKKDKPTTTPALNAINAFTQKATGGISVPSVEKWKPSTAVKEKGKETFASVLDIPKTILQETARSGGSLALSALNLGLPKEQEIEEFQPTDELSSKIKNVIFGPKPIKSIQKRMREAESSFVEEGLPLIGTKVSPGVAKPLSIIGVGGMIVADFLGAGEGKGIIKALTKVNKAEDVVGLLKAAKISEGVIIKYADDIAKTSKLDDMEKIMKNVITEHELLNTSKNIIDKTTKSFNWTERGFGSTINKSFPDMPSSIGGKYVPRSTDRLAIKARTLIADDIVTAERVAMTGTDDAAVAVGSELIKKYSADAAATGNKLLYDRAGEVAHTMARNLTDSGRAIQAATILGRLTPEGVLRFAAKEINKYNEAIDIAKSKPAYKRILGPKNKIPELTAEQSEWFLKESKRITEITDGIDKAIAWKKLNDVVAQLTPTPMFKKLIGLWKVGLLTGWKTHALNTFSNLFHGATEGLKDIPASAVDVITSMLTGERKLIATGKGSLNGLKEGVSKGWKYLTTGFDERNIAQKLDRKAINWGNGKLAKAIKGYEETVYRLLGSADQPFYYTAKRRSLYSQAMADAKNKGLKGAEAQKHIEKLVLNPTDDMLHYAVADAEIAVFQNETALGKLARGVQKLADGAGEYVVPFGRTPAAVATQLINYSPVGMVKTILQNIGKGVFDQRMFAQGIGRGITGTAIAFMGAALSRKNMITTTYPKTEREQKLWELEGRQPNSIKIDGKWRNVASLGPAGFVLVAGAHYQEGLQETGSLLGGFQRASIGGAKTLTEQTFLQGTSQVLNVLGDPERYASGYFSNTLKSFVPTIIRDVASATDPKERRYSTIPEVLKSTIPGLRQTLEPRIDAFVNEVARRRSFLETMIDPTRPTTEKETPVIKELRRLWDAGYKAVPTQLGEKNGYDSLTPEENTYLWKLAGKIAEGKITALVQTPEYAAMIDEDKAKYISDFADNASYTARLKTILEVTDGLSGDALVLKLGELKSSGLMTSTLFDEFLEITAGE